MRTDGDVELLQRCRAGEEEAWRLLVERYEALVYSIPARYGLPRAECDDVFGEVWSALFSSLAKIRDAQALPQWLIRTATRATWESARKSKRKVPEDLPPLTGAAPPLEFAELLESEQRVRDALTRISARCANLLRLLYFTSPEPNYDQIAKRLDMPRGSIGPTRRRCLDRMRVFLPDSLGGVSKRRSGPSSKGER
jgi:RNA polymerase sigma factor (sigma-70 family)